MNTNNSGIDYLFNKLASTFSQNFQPHYDLSTTSRTSIESSSFVPIHHLSKPSSVKRKDQIKPTIKIGVSSTTIPSKRHDESSFSFFKQRQKQVQMQRYEENQRMLKSLDYNNIKPTFGFAKYFMMCGMEKGQGLKGCTCFSQPCQWSIKWTKSLTANSRKVYKNLCYEKCPQKSCEQIQKDLPRTYPNCPTFSMNFQFRSKLRNILRIYSIYDMQTGYVQGMNMVAAVLLYHIKREDEAFWAFVDLMDEGELRLLYSEGFKALKQHSENIITIMESKINDLYQFMLQIDVNPEVFLYGWLLSLMSNCVPLEYMHIVLQKFRVQGWAFIYKLVITFLLFLKKPLLVSNDAAEFLTQLNNANSKDLGMQWGEILENCYKVQI